MSTPFASKPPRANGNFSLVISLTFCTPLKLQDFLTKDSIRKLTLPFVLIESELSGLSKTPSAEYGAYL